MKIKSNLKENFWKVYNESRYIAMHKNSILKKEKINKANFFEEVVLIYAIIMMIASGIMIIKQIDNIYAYILIVIAFTYLIYNLIRSFEGYQFRKNKEFKSEIIINKEGITDPSSFNGVELTFKWDIIKGIVAYNNSVVILTNKKVYFYFDITQKTKIIKEIRKHKKNIKIIDN